VEKEKLTFDHMTLIQNYEALRLSQSKESAEFVTHMGVLWKRTPVGFEARPYCKECRSVMTPVPRARIWVCSTGGHHAPLGVNPPTD